MDKFNYDNELKKIINSKQIVEVNLRGDNDHAVAYILDANDDYLTFAKISNEAALSGVTICLTNDIESIQIETKFIKELSKYIENDSIYKQALRTVEGVKKFSFEGIISAFAGSENLIEITTVDNDNFSGKVIAFDAKALVLDEYYPQDQDRFARTYLNPTVISRIIVGGTWLRITAGSLKN